MQIRFLEYLIALSQEGHFARAAQRCNVSQPALSAGLVALEELLGARLVDRDRRYQGLTAQGKAMLPWAQQMVAAHKGLTTAISLVDGPLTGTLRIGTVPAAVPVMGDLTRALRTLHPSLRLSIRSMTSSAISQGLAAYELDAGVTYIDHEPPADVVSVDLYTETHRFLVAQSYPRRFGDVIDLADALDQPLCLLHQGMHNRRILDGQLAKHGLTADPGVLADSFEALIATIASGAYATILPDSYGMMLPSWAKTSSLAPGLAPCQIGLVVSDRKPFSPLSEAALALAKRISTPELSRRYD
ncbi:LysR family transcriptional regulator [Sphingobium sp. CFD-1]|uniref:LysR family transcriptional regulator n=1 Tax=Sphingobium sp. CFD-1 TaxID=2878545 RepID=UPI00214CBE25|nr:LysR family transcriptional regulator [Sphingobium sp. CFD-1]